MAVRGFPTGVGVLYGVVIGDLLQTASSVEELSALRDQIDATVKTQGDLVRARDAVDKEIEKRGGGAQESASAARPTSQSFLVKLLGRSLPDDVTKRLEDRITGVVLEELGKIDMKGDLKATPLSQVETWGAEFSPGSNISGIVMPDPALMK